MTKTENFQLPQWEAGDPVRREDFNGAMAAIDAGLHTAAEGATDAFTPDNLPYVFGDITIPSGDETGIVLTTFPFKPSAVLFMRGVSISICMRQVIPCKLIINDVSQYDPEVRYTVSVYINDKKLMLSSRSSSYGGSVYYMAFR